MSKMPIDDLDARIRQLTEACRAYRGATGRTASTAELGELHACKLLGLARAPTNTPGYDATDAQGRRVQVKSRAPWSAAHVDERGRIGRFTTWTFDYALLVLFDGDCSPEAIWQAEQGKLRRLQAAIASPAHGLHVRAFTTAGHRVWPASANATLRSSAHPSSARREPTLKEVRGCPPVDAALANFPHELEDALARAFPKVMGIAGYQRRPTGYKCWKVPGQQRRVENWLQWNDGDKKMRIEFPNGQGEMRRWKLFARFDDEPHPGPLWDRPKPYDVNTDQIMPGGADVWGCSYEALTEHLPRLQELRETLKGDLVRSCRYALQRYGRHLG